MCKEEKDLTNFSTKSHRCKPCSVIAARKWRESNPGKRTDSGPLYYAANKLKEQARQKRYRANNKEKDYSRTRNYLKSHPEKVKIYLRRSRLLKTYNLTLEQYDAMLIAQNNQCFICCSTVPSRRKDRNNFAVDHCHTTGKIRGLLCSDCNIGLGMFKDDPILLQTAATYIEAARR